jgi:hypothetical protein
MHKIFITNLRFTKRDIQLRILVTEGSTPSCLLADNTCFKHTDKGVCQFRSVYRTVSRFLAAIQILYTSRCLLNVMLSQCNNYAEYLVSIFHRAFKKYLTSFEK